MPVIRTFRKVDSYIEDFEEFCAPEVYPIFSAIDYADETPEPVEMPEGKEINSDVGNSHLAPSFWKKWLSVLKIKPHKL